MNRNCLPFQLRWESLIRNRIHDFEFKLLQNLCKKNILVIQEVLWISLRVVSSKQSPKIGHKLPHIYLAPFSTTITFFGGYLKKRKKHALHFHEQLLISTSSSFSHSGVFLIFLKWTNSIPLIPTCLEIFPLCLFLHLLQIQ